MSCFYQDQQSKHCYIKKWTNVRRVDGRHFNFAAADADKKRIYGKHFRKGHVYYYTWTWLIKAMMEGKENNDIFHFRLFYLDNNIWSKVENPPLFQLLRSC